MPSTSHIQREKKTNRVKRFCLLLFLLDNNLYSLKVTSTVQQYQSRIKVFLYLSLLQQLKFDNFLSIIHSKWSVKLIIEFLVGHHLEMWCSCITVPDPHSLIAIVFIKSRDWHYNVQTSHFKMAAHRKFSDQKQSLSMNYV